MKIDDKGMTLVELLVTFSLLLLIVVGLYNLILEVKFEIDDRQIIKDTVEFSSFINNDIHYNLLLDKPFAILIKEENVPGWSCKPMSSGLCRDGNNTTVIVAYKPGADEKGNKQVIYSELNTTCKNIYPCGVYYYYDVSKQVISSKVIALNKDNDTNSLKSLQVKGVLYGVANNPIFESVPNNDFIEIRDIEVSAGGNSNASSTIKATKPYIEVSDNVLTINYGLYIIDNDTNYGFKIAYPFS